MAQTSQMFPLQPCGQVGAWKDFSKGGRSAIKRVWEAAPAMELGGLTPAGALRIRGEGGFERLEVWGWEGSRQTLEGSRTTWAW